MTSVELTNLQWQITTVLTNEYQRTGESVRSQTLADVLERAPGMDRNKMQQLKHLGLVDSVPGPGGGYEPTQTAFEKLGREPLEDMETVPLSKDFTRLRGSVDDITFLNVPHPETCAAHVTFRESVAGVENGDPIIIGLTPLRTSSSPAKSEA